MKIRVRKLWRVVPVGVLAVVAASCGTQGYAAKVNGQTISVSALDRELKEVTSNAAFVSLLKSEKSVVYGAGGKGTYASSFVDDLLNRRITVTEVRQIEAKMHLAPTAVESKLAKALTIESVSSASVFSAFPRSYQRRLVSDTEAIVTLEAHLEHRSLSTASIASYYGSHKASFKSYCSSIILEGTAAQDQKILGELARGKSFASLAEADKDDGDLASNGGAVGCGTIQDYAETFNATVAGDVLKAALNTPSPPLEISQGYAILEVTSEKEPSLSSAEVEVANAILGPNGSTALDSYLAKQAKYQSVVVNPAYGTVKRTKSFVGIVPAVGFPKGQLDHYYVPSENMK